MRIVSNEFKNAIKQLNVYSHGKIEITDSYGTLLFNEDSIIKIDISGSAFVNDRILGSIAAITLNAELLGNQTGLINRSTEKVLVPYIGIQTDDLVEYVKYQNFLITELVYDDTNDKTKIVAVDYTYKLNTLITSSISYPVTLFNYLVNVLADCGLELENSSLFNGAFPVQSKPFNDEVSAKEIINRIAELTLSYVVINQSTNKIEFKKAFSKIADFSTNHLTLSNYDHDELSEYAHQELGFLGNSTLDFINKNNYWNLKLYEDCFKSGGVNTLVLKISQVDGENNTLNDAAMVSQDGIVEVSIIDNPFINTEAKRLSVINAMFSEVKEFKYTPYSIEYRGYPYLELGDFVGIYKMNEGLIYTPIYDFNIRFDGGLYGNLKARSLSLNNTKYQFTPSLAQKVRNAEIMVDKANAEISLKVSQDNLLSSINLSPESIRISSAKLDIDSYVTFTGLSTSGQTTINGANISTGTLTANKITSGTMSADRLYGGTIDGNTINVTNLNAGNITVGNLSASRVSGGTLSGTSINIGSGNFSVNSSGVLTAKSGTIGGASFTNSTSGSLYLGGALYVHGGIVPRSDNAYNLGYNSARWVDVWAVDTTINSSDETAKKDIANLEKGMDFIMKLRPVTYKWKDGKRDHLGFIAQEVKCAMDETGFDAGVYIDPTMSSNFSQNEEQTAHYKGIRYSELIAPLVQTVQIQQNLINELIKRIDALEAQEV